MQFVDLAVDPTKVVFHYSADWCDVSFSYSDTTTPSEKNRRQRRADAAIARRKAR